MFKYKKDASERHNNFFISISLYHTNINVKLTKRKENQINQAQFDPQRPEF